MTNLKVLSAAAALALLLPLAVPTQGSAQMGSKASGGGGSAVGAAIGGGGGGGGAAMGGGGGGAAIGGGGYPRGGGSALGAAIGSKAGGGFVGGGGGPRYSGGSNWQGGGHVGGHRHHHRRGYGYGYGGVGAGLVIGGALASQSYGYYGSPGYGYYDDGYYDEPVVAVAPGGDDVEYCRRTYRSYDVRSGTYLGNDGYRHACP